tara:strand:+ start:23681 stop:24043 length:363 start_codon:yes stop_codon:yes gene_type:complete
MPLFGIEGEPEDEDVEEGVDAVLGIPEDDPAPLCPEAVGLEDGPLELLLEDEELDEELEDELDEDGELEDDELLLEDSGGELWVTEVWQAPNNKLSVRMLSAAIFLCPVSALPVSVFMII